MVCLDYPGQKQTNPVVRVLQALWHQAYRRSFWQSFADRRKRFVGVPARPCKMSAYSSPSCTAPAALLISNSCGESCYKNTVFFLLGMKRGIQQNQGVTSSTNALNQIHHISHGFHTQEFNTIVFGIKLGFGGQNDVLITQ